MLRSASVSAMSLLGHVMRGMRIPGPCGPPGCAGHVDAAGAVSGLITGQDELVQQLNARRCARRGQARALSASHGHERAAASLKLLVFY
jgi:hypothetical protein